MLLQCRYSCKFPASSIFSSGPGGDGGTPWGPGAASAESCTHPAMRDRCFPPPIAERQRLPNVGIIYFVTCLEVFGGAMSELVSACCGQGGPWLIKRKYGLCGKNLGFIKEFTLIVF